MTIAKDQKAVLIALDPDVKARLEEAARLQDMSMTKFVRRAIRAALDGRVAVPTTITPDTPEALAVCALVKLGSTQTEAAKRVRAALAADPGADLETLIVMGLPKGA